MDELPILVYVAFCLGWAFGGAFGRVCDMVDGDRSRTWVDELLESVFSPQPFGVSMSHQHLFDHAALEHDHASSEAAANSLTKVAAPNVRGMLDKIWSAAAEAGKKINWTVVLPDLIAVFAAASNPALLQAAIAKLVADIFGSNVPTSVTDAIPASV